jgi:LAS superfamily LD-carboxypeptidase LdcB
MKYILYKFLTLVSLFLLTFCYPEQQPLAEEQKSPDLNSIFTQAGGMTKFLTGRYEQVTILSEIKDISGTKNHYLLPEVAKQWKAMSMAFDKEKSKNSKQSLFLVSTFRNFNQQKSIWESKFSGQRKMREPVKGKSPEEIVSLILEFSSAPGTSRHHWGTDLDLNALENSYFEKGGKGFEIYNWLSINAKRFGFCQPYNAKSLRNNKGYEEEKWHWSYRPISSSLRQMWISEFNSKTLKMEGYKGSEIMNSRALDYVSEVANDCK